MEAALRAEDTAGSTRKKSINNEVHQAPIKTQTQEIGNEPCLEYRGCVRATEGDRHEPPVTLIEPGTVRVERLLPGPVERLWAYITDSRKRATWLAGGEFESRVGGKARLEFDNNSLSSDKNPPAKYANDATGHFEGVITRLEPMRRLSLTWPMSSTSDTEVSFELEPRGKDVLLVIVHRRLGSDLLPSFMAGWEADTGILEDVLTGVEPRPFWSTLAKAEEEYAAAV